MSYVPPQILSSGTTAGDFLHGGISRILDNLITVLGPPLPIPDPTAAPTISASGGGSSGGLLAAGVYYLKETQSGGFGETKPATESAAFTVATQSNAVTAATVAVGSNSLGLLGAGGYMAYWTHVDSTTGGQTLPSLTSAIFTVNAGNTPVLTFPALAAFASGRDLYLTPANGSSGTETLYATGITATTYTLSSNLWMNGTTAQASAPAAPTVNTTSTNIPTVTFSTMVSNGVAHNLYLTPANGNTGTELAYARGLTTTTYNLSAAAPSNSYAVAPPLVNSTDYSFLDANGNGQVAVLNGVHALKNGFATDSVVRLNSIVREFTAGIDPGNHMAVLDRVRQMHGVFALMAQACLEAGVLIEANPGTIHQVQKGAGFYTPVRQFP